MSHILLTDSDIAHVLTMKTAVEKVEAALLEKSRNSLISPPRMRVQAGEGSLVFTAGAALGQENVTGFRVYDTYPGDHPGKTQLVTVYDVTTGALRGIVLGERLGAMRTGALGGVAVKYMAAEKCDVLAVLGTGLQARYQVEAALAVRDFREIRVYSRSAENRQQFVAWARRMWHIPVVDVISAQACVDNADVVICATSSKTPVFQKEWLKPGAHVNTLGPKAQGAHETDLSYADTCEVIATDSLDQAAAYPKPFFLLGTAHQTRMAELSEIVAARVAGRLKPEGNTLFCSVGLSGTEVVVANEALRLAREQGIGMVVNTSSGL